MKRSPMTFSIAATLVGALLVAIGLGVDPRQALFSYLAAWVFATSLAVGALLWVLIAHAVNAGWMVVLRRRAEDITSTLPLLAVLFLPVLLGLRVLYPWARPEGEWTDAVREAVLPKHGWLNEPFFMGRAVLYLGAWVAVAERIRRLSRGQDASPFVATLVSQQRTLAAASLPLVAFTLTFAAFDWLMSLDPTWSSNVFGIYLFGGGFGAAVGLLCFIGFGPVSSRVAAATQEHSHALGRLLFAFVIFWAYIAFCQYLLIWIADLPDEVGWVKLRTTGTWGVFAIVLASIHFVLPFFALLSRALKRLPPVLAWMGAWLVVAHYADMHWVVLPELHASFHPHWLDVGCLLFICGACTFVALVRARREPAMPLHDPRLGAGLHYEAS